MIPPIVHLSTSKPVERKLDIRRAFALNEKDMPAVTALDLVGRNSQAYEILDYLDVEHQLRYKPTAKSTWCNIYAYDFCMRVGVYLPHVFWNDAALKKLAKGEPVAPLYEKTITELSANGLSVWLDTWGPAYGWAWTQDAGIAQEMVNRGGAGVVCALIKPIGHISVILPESSFSALRSKTGKVLAPLQSQAGRKNKRVFSGNWWGTRAKRWGFYIHKSPLEGIFDATAHVIDIAEDAIKAIGG